MKKATKAILERTIWLGRGTATVMGVAMLLAVVLGVGTTALAAVPGDPFKLGQANGVNAITRLAGTTNTALLRINNASTGPDATALDLQVAPGKPPMTVNSTTEVQGLNVDSLDSRNSSDFLQEDSDRDDFLPDNTYTEVEQESGPGTGAFVFVSAFCDPGDIALGGGGADAFPLDEGNRFVVSSPSQLDPRRWDAQFVDENDGDIFRAFVRCADFPPLR